MWFKLEQVDIVFVPPLRIRPGIFGDLERKYSRRQEELGSVFYDVHYEIIKKLCRRAFSHADKCEDMISTATSSVWQKVRHMRFWDEPQSPIPTPVPVSHAEALIRVHCTWAKIKILREIDSSFTKLEEAVKKVVEESAILKFEIDSSTGTKVVYNSDSGNKNNACNFSKTLQNWINCPQEFVFPTSKTEEISEDVILTILNESNGFMPFATLVAILKSLTPISKVSEISITTEDGDEIEFVNSEISAADLLEIRLTYDQLVVKLNRLNKDERMVVFLSLTQGQPATPFELALVCEFETVESLAERLLVETDTVESWQEKFKTQRQTMGVKGLTREFVAGLLSIEPGLVTSRLKEARKKLNYDQVVSGYEGD